MNNPSDNHAPHLFVLGSGALGDTISAIPAMRYAAENIFPSSKMKIMIPRELRDLFDFIPEESVFYMGVEGQQVLPDTVIVRQYDNFPPGLIPQMLHPSAILSPQRMSLVNYSSMKYLGMVLDIKDQGYPTPNLDHVDISKFDLPEKYACILVTNLNLNRSLPFDESYKIAKYFLRQNITPVFMGKNTKIYDQLHDVHKQGTSPKALRWMIDLVDKTSFMEAAHVMARAQCVVGADTGLIHLAACTDVKIVCGYTTVGPELRIPVRHGEIGWNFKAISPPASSCRFCASDWHRYDVNFNECHHKDMQCVSTALNAENFIKAIENILLE